MPPPSRWRSSAWRRTHGAGTRSSTGGPRDRPAGVGPRGRVPQHRELPAGIVEHRPQRRETPRRRRGQPRPRPDVDRRGVGADLPDRRRRPTPTGCCRTRTPGSSPPVSTSSPTRSPPSSTGSSRRTWSNTPRSSTPRQLAAAAHRIAYLHDQDGVLADEAYRDRHRALTIAQRVDGSAHVQGELTAPCAEALLTMLDSLAAPRPESDGIKDTRTAGERNHDGLLDGLNRLLVDGGLPPPAASTPPSCSP